MQHLDEIVISTLEQLEHNLLIPLSTLQQRGLPLPVTNSLRFGWQAVAGEQRQRILAHNIIAIASLQAVLQGVLKEVEAAPVREETQRFIPR